MSLIFKISSGFGKLKVAQIRAHQYQIFFIKLWPKFCQHVHYYQSIITTQKLLSLKFHVIYFKIHSPFLHGLKVSSHWEVLPNLSGVSRKFFPSLIWLSIEIKFKYQPEEKEIDVVEQLELYSLMMSRWSRQTSRTRSQSLSFLS